MPVVADLHVHTTNSDGSMPIEALPTAAKRAGLEAVAVTDHDRLHPALPAPVSVRGDVLVIHGIELRVEGPDERVDLLGYGVDPTTALREELARLQRDRRERGGRIIDRVEAHLDIDLDLESREGLGRPHIARAIAEHPGTDYTVQGVFDELIGDGGPCFVPRAVPDFATGRALLSEAAALVGLAHPFRYDDPEAALALTAALDAVERWYPYDRPVDPDADPVEADLALVDDAIAAHDLVPTGGSDAHDDRLGRMGLDAATFERVRERLT